MGQVCQTCHVAKTPSSTPDRRAALLDAAFATFVRFGFRKTSMDDVAREAGISRQALYAYFADKEDLFRGAMRHGLESAMSAVDEAFGDEEAELDVRLVRGLDEWLGRLLERRGTDGSDLGEAGKALLGTLFSDFAAIFEKKVARVIAESPLAAACRDARTTPQQIAETLCACALGWKHRARSRAEFVAQMEVAVRLMLPKARNR
jgi:AcrR family transcriptional regulator